MSTIALETDSSCIRLWYAASVRSSAIVSITSAIARSTAASTAGVSPRPTSSTTAGSHAITCTRPGQPPIARTKRSIVIGSIECGSIVSPSSISAGTSSGSTSITYSVPGSPPCWLTSTITSAL